MLEGYKPYDIFICKKCGICNSGLVLHDYTCEYCGGIIEYTGHDREYWFQEYYKNNPGQNSKNTTGIMMFKWLRETYLHNDFDHSAHEKTLQAKRDEWNTMLAENAEFRRNTLHCPKCGSYDVRRDKRGFKLGRAMVAGALTGFLDVAAVAGAAGSNKMVNRCDKCGHTWQ